MNRLLQAVRRYLDSLLRFVGFEFPEDKPRLVPFPGGATPWNERDRDQFKAFVGSSTGRRWVARLQAMESATAVAACQDKIHTADSAARAGGYSEALRHMLSLANAAERVEERPEDAEKLSPDAELIARLSP
jgi:hypothetical protein